MSVRPEFAGRTGQCPRCKQPVTVPLQSVGAAPQPMPPPAPVRAQPTGPTTGPMNRPIPPPAGRPGPGPAPAGPGARLEVVHGPPAVLGRVFTLVPGRPGTIGRDAGCEVPIPSDRVSRRHCQLTPSPDGSFVLDDLGSSNGTLVNQERIAGRRNLRGGEYIQAGDCLLRFTVG